MPKTPDTGPLYHDGWKLFQSPEITSAIRVQAPIDVVVFNDPHALRGVVIYQENKPKNVLAQLVVIAEDEVHIYTPATSLNLEHIFPQTQSGEPIKAFNPQTCGLDIMINPQGENGLEISYHYVPPDSILTSNHKIHQI